MEQCRCCHPLSVEQLDPLLKAAGDLQGNLRALAEGDFAATSIAATSLLEFVSLVQSFSSPLLSVSLTRSRS